MGYNFSDDLEGKVNADGSYKDLSGDMAFALGVQGRVYDFTPRVSLAVGLGYEFARSFDQATVILNNAEVVAQPPTGNPSVSFWSLYTQAQAQLLDKLTAFGGINFSLPSVSNVPWSLSGDLGFQAGAAYEVYKQIQVEGLVKITNLNLRNQLGDTTDVSLAGIELRGRYTF